MSTSKKKSDQKKAGTNKEKDPSVESSISSSENSDENNINSLLSDQKRIGEIEYRKNVLKALKQAINENDKLRESVTKLNEENAKMKNELNDKDNSIRELYDYYNVFCYLLIFIVL